jgi:hypothetical protein
MVARFGNYNARTTLSHSASSDCIQHHNLNFSLGMPQASLAPGHRCRTAALTVYNELVCIHFRLPHPRLTSDLLSIERINDPRRHCKDPTLIFLVSHITLTLSAILIACTIHFLVERYNDIKDLLYRSSHDLNANKKARHVIDSIQIALKVPKMSKLQPQSCHCRDHSS